MRAPLVLALSASVAALAAAVPSSTPTSLALDHATPPRTGHLIFPPFKGVAGASGFGWNGGGPARPGGVSAGTFTSLSAETFQVSAGGAQSAGVSDGSAGSFVAAPDDATALVAPGRIGSAFGGARSGGTTASGGDNGSRANGAGGGAGPALAAEATGGVLEGESFVADAAATPADGSTGALSGDDGGIGNGGFGHGGFGIGRGGGSGGGGSGSNPGNGVGNPPTVGGGDPSSPLELSKNPTVISDLRRADSGVLISSVVTSVPEAPTLALFAPGLLGLALLRRPRRNA